MSLMEAAMKQDTKAPTVGTISITAVTIQVEWFKVNDTGRADRHEVKIEADTPEQAALLANKIIFGPRP